MANELLNSLKSVTEKITTYVSKAGELKVETRYVVMEGGAARFEEACPAALTIIKLDGDCEAILPMVRTETGLAVDNALFELHERNVATAIEYRTRMMGAMLQTLREAVGR